MTKTIKIFNREASIKEWAGDRSCKVPYSTLVRRINDGWDYERAITEERDVGGRPGKFYEAFKTSKTIRQWSVDPRCVVEYELLRNRLRYGWSVEKALTTPKLRSKK